ncbi:MAG TPA: YraN family protein [Euzebya sp.]|nr:YraN family protein [Euzebya sp.]
MHPRQILGREGEDLAATHLTDAGYEILHRNWQATDVGVRGELDIIARHGSVLAVCEVKTRRSHRRGTPIEAVGREKRRRLRRLTGAYLQANPHAGPVRGDVISIDVTSQVSATDTVVVHLRGVW